MQFIGDTMIMQGGQDDQSMKSASLAIARFKLHGTPKFSFPWQGFSMQTGGAKLIGEVLDSTDAGFPPGPYSMTVSQVISLGPLIFSGLGNTVTPHGFLPCIDFYYPEGMRTTYDVISNCTSD